MRRYAQDVDQLDVRTFGSLQRYKDYRKGGQTPMSKFSWKGLLKVVGIAAVGYLVKTVEVSGVVFQILDLLK